MEHGNKQRDSLKSAITAQCLIILEFIKQHDSFEETNKVKALDNRHDKIRNYIDLRKKNCLPKIINKFGNYYIENIPTCGVVILKFEDSNTFSPKKGVIVKTIFPRDLK